MQNYRMRCRNSKCGSEFLRRFSAKQWEDAQYGGDRPGVACYNCGTPSMAVMRSEQTVKDGFVPGFQRNIRKFCNTYAEYKSWLKIMGLIEFGYEDLPDNEDGTPKTTGFTDEMISKIQQSYGLDGVSGNEIEHLKVMHLEPGYMDEIKRDIPIEHV